MTRHCVAVCEQMANARRPTAGVGWHSLDLFDLDVLDHDELAADLAASHFRDEVAANLEKIRQKGMAAE